MRIGEERKKEGETYLNHFASERQTLLVVLDSVQQIGHTVHGSSNHSAQIGQVVAEQAGAATRLRCAAAAAGH